jgi:hypothetical protein
LNVAQKYHCPDEDSDGERQEGDVVFSFCFGAAHSEFDFFILGV